MSKKKNQIKNFTSDLKFPIKGSSSKFHITWLLNFDKKFTSWIEKKGLVTSVLDISATFSPFANVEIGINGKKKWWEGRTICKSSTRMTNRVVLFIYCPPKQFILTKPVQILSVFVKKITDFFSQKNRSAFSFAPKRSKFCNFRIMVLRHPRASSKIFCSEYLKNWTTFAKMSKLSNEQERFFISKMTPSLIRSMLVHMKHIILVLLFFATLTHWNA